jgi:four helix bundle protein
MSANWHAMASRGRVVRGYKDLEVWQKAMDLVVETYRLTKPFPSDERFGLIAQLRRASVSVPSNIAEGRGRFGLGGFLYHLSVATGSFVELETQFLISERLQYLNPSDAKAVLARVSEVRRLLAGMVRALRAKREDLRTR